MTTYADLPRYSRNGDQFHYLWAARRCLGLLNINSNLVAVTIEGASKAEGAVKQDVNAGEELIDVGEYYGSENYKLSEKICYYQLKHSTTQKDKDWTASGLETTIHGFAIRYKAIVAAMNGVLPVEGKVTFHFVTNRPISKDVIEAVKDLSQGNTYRNAKECNKFIDFSGLNGSILQNFYNSLRLEGNQDFYQEQRLLLQKETLNYLPGSDSEAPNELKELVTRKALSENEDTPSISRIDVLRALKTDESCLFPAPCLITEPTHFVERSISETIINQILCSPSSTSIIHSIGGVGKSVFALHLPKYFPQHSEAVIYDCFGNGEYRNTRKARHRYSEALVQIANELASRNLCYPLIPNSNAQAKDYLKAFRSRLEQSAEIIRHKNKEAYLCIVIDAADNAEMAAKDFGENRSFVKDLIRESVPEGIKIVFLCRSYRIDLLDPPPSVLQIELPAFSFEETAQYVKSHHPHATDVEIAEFQRLSSGNPRVQNNALSQYQSFSDVLRSFGPNPIDTEDLIQRQLNLSIQRLMDQDGKVETALICSICESLSILRPYIPIKVLAAISNTSEAAIRSFVVSFGRSIRVTDNTLYFVDEPTESWFRQKYRPTGDTLDRFIQTLTPLAKQDAYIAGSLPFLLLEAGKYEDLVKFALQSDSLSNFDLATKKDIDNQKLQFALKACLRLGRYCDAAKLSFKAGIESAGNSRFMDLVQKNTDLASIALGINRVQGIVYRRELSDTWQGSHYAYETGLLSQHQELLGDALSRRRISHDWLKARLEKKKSDNEFGDRNEEISVDDVAELAWATYCMEGATQCAQELMHWRPRESIYKAMRSLAKRFIDHGKFFDLLQISEGTKHHPVIVLAIAIELHSINQTMPGESITRTLRLLQRAQFKLPEIGKFTDEYETLCAVLAIIISAIKSNISSNSELLAVLKKYSTQSSLHSLTSRYNPSKSVVMGARSLFIGLTGMPLAIEDFADNELSDKLKNKKYSHDSSVSFFRSNVGAVLPLYQLWVDCVFGKVQESELDQRIADTQKKLQSTIQHLFDNKTELQNEYVLLFSHILVLFPIKQERLNAFNTWLKNEKTYYPKTFIYLARITARTRNFQSVSFFYAGKAEILIKGQGESAENILDSYVDIARSVLAVSSKDAVAYFNKALEYSNRIGDEHLSRWSSVLDLAEKTGECIESLSELSYKLARCAELVYKYVARDKYFPWERTIQSIIDIDPISSFAIFSRWRDRNFGWHEKILSIAVRYLLNKKIITPEVAFTMTGVQAPWEHEQLIQALLESTNNDDTKKKYLSLYLQKLRLICFDQSTWESIRTQLIQAHINYSGIDEIVGFLRNQNHTETCTSDYTSQTQSLQDEESWEPVFEGLDLSLEKDVRSAYKRYLGRGFPRYIEKFFTESFHRIQLGKEPEYIQSLSSISDFNGYSLFDLLQHYPESWKERPGIRASLQELLKSVVSRYCISIAKDDYRDEMLFQPAKACCGITEDDLFRTVLISLSEYSDDFDSERLFTLNSLLAPMLSPTEAKEALEYCLGSFEPQLEDSDGDGPWKESLAPGESINESIAGYIWFGLASPVASLRWEFAHVVVNLSKYNLPEIFDLIVQKAQRKDNTGFVHESFHFYYFHAIQWFLIAIARIAKDSTAFICQDKDFLLSFLNKKGQSHIMFHELAKQALNFIQQNFLSDFTDAELSLIQNTNTSPFSFAIDDNQIYRNVHVEKSETLFQFGFDFGPSWLAPLGRIFGINQTEMEKMTNDVLVNELNMAHFAEWNSDRRQEADVYPREGTSHSHGSYPQADNLHFYLLYHAMMVVAAKLLETKPVHNPYNEKDPFGEWMQGHLITRKDGYWLSDRRDPLSSEWPDWKNDSTTTNWRWSVQKKDFDRALGLEGDSITVFGGWNYATFQKNERISIHSALVSPERSFALLRAFQTAESNFDYKIPDATDELEIDDHEYKLKGWIQTKPRDNGIDAQDPWSGGISNDIPVPSAEICKRLQLESDPLSRIWCISGQPVLWAQVWSSGNEKPNDDDVRETGTRLISSKDFIVQLMEKTSMDLIVEVEISRDLANKRYQQKDSDYLGYVEPYTRIYLFRGDNEIYTL